MSSNELCFDSLQLLIVSDVDDGAICSTFGYYLLGDGGGGRYLISHDMGSIPEIAYKCSNGLYAILLHNGSITLEQLGAIGELEGETAFKDSWAAFYKAYQIKKNHQFTTNIEFILSKNAYYCSKPILICTGMVLRTAGTSWICKIIYGGDTVSKNEVSDTQGVYATDESVVYSSIKAQVIFVNEDSSYCYYSSLIGVQFRNGSDVTGDVLYGIYAPYCGKVVIENVRCDGVSIGLYGRDIWGSLIKGSTFIGINTSLEPASGTVGVKIEPYLGVDAYELGGTSNVYQCVGVSGFQIGFKITRQEYSTFESCYSEKGNDVVMEFHGCDGISITGFGIENLINTLYAAVRFYNTRASIDSLTFAYNCKISGGSVVWANNRSIICIQSISFGRVINTGSFITLFLVNTNGVIDVRTYDIPDSLKLSPGYAFASIESSGRFISDHVFTSGLGVANGTSNNNAVDFSINDLKYKMNGNSISLQYSASWSGGEGTDFQVFGFPRLFSCDGFFNAILLSTGRTVIARWLKGTNRVKLFSAIDGVSISIPESGTLIIQGEYFV
ncbi:hypothetical protein TUM12370_20380 [Salmonella enterica subsp. enterica serovar Choleraesuis]|nr:hypothetical protein TUM12370_20380 [Salmonella enterica subsp. enterica serovar Choleraesuis]